MRRSYFHWRRLVEKYSRPIHLHIRGKGRYDGGVYVQEPEMVHTVFGACIAMKRPSQTGDGGNYAREDKHLYLLQPIPHALEDVKVECGRQLYTVTTDRDHGNEEFTGVYAYYLTWVSKFDPPPAQEVILDGQKC